MKSFISRTVVALATLAGVLPAASAALAQNNVVHVRASKDATIFLDPTKASGQGPALFAGTDGQPAAKRSLLFFDVSAVPAGATIERVAVRLYLARAAGGGGQQQPRNISLHALLQEFGEGPSGNPTDMIQGQGYPAVDGDATWTHARLPNDLWGGAGPGGNFEHAPSATRMISQFGQNSENLWEQQGLIDDVQAWVNGTRTNYGWILKNDDELSARTFLAFWSDEGAEQNTMSGVAFAPMLEIEYSRGEACEPGAACGGFAGGDCGPHGTCVDDDTDECDPDDGGNDCLGMCVCK